MQPLYTIASTTDTMASKLELEVSTDFRPVWQARPGNAVPVAVQEHPTLLQEGFWGYPKPAANFVPMHRILARKPFHLAIRNQRCAMPANGIVGVRDAHPFLITMLNHRLFCLGGVYSMVSGIPRFGVLQTSAPSLFDGYLDFLPVLLTPKDLKLWLTTTDLGKVMEMADRSQDHWFDFFRISQEVLQTPSNKQELLTPLGERFSDILNRQQKSNATVFTERRRRKGKG